MIKHQELIFALSGQSFFLDVPEGRPDAGPTVTVYLSTNSDIAGAETATTGVVALDSVDTVLSADAAASDTTVQLANAAGVVKNRRYLITGADGGTELIEVLGVNGMDVTLRRPLANAYASGATFQGTRISIGVNSTWINDQSRVSDILGVNWRTDREPRTDWLAGYAGYRVRWSYAIGGVPTIGTSFADVVRYSAKSYVNPLDVNDRFPGWIDRLPTDYQHDQGASLLLTSFYEVKFDAIGDNQALRRIRNTEILAELAVFRANVVIAENAILSGAAQDSRAYDLAKDLYRQRYNQLFREPKFQVDQTSGGESAQARRQPLFRR